MQKRTKNIRIDYLPDIQLDDSTCLSYSSATHSPSDEPITSLHYHDSLEIGYCYEGSGVFVIDENIISFSKNDASIIFKNQIHIAQSNKGNLRRLFYRSLSLSPVEYVIKFRIKMASVLLSSTTDSMLEVSNKVGFSSLSSFNRHFKTIIGMSPLQWRKNNRNL